MKKFGRQILSVTFRALVLCTVFLIGSLPAFAGTIVVQGENPAALGDINADGRINAVDARWVLQTASGARTLNDAQTIAADVNGDNKVNAVDARWILQAASGARILGESASGPVTPPAPDTDGNVSVGTDPDDDRDAVIIW